MEEFYCFVRPKLLIYALDQNDLMDIKCEQDVLSKLRPPLSLKVMREYFAELSSLEMNT